MSKSQGTGDGKKKYQKGARTREEQKVDTAN